MSDTKMEPSEAMLPEKQPEDVKEVKSGMKFIVRQTVIALGPILSTIAAGMTSGYSSVLLPQLNTTNINDTAIYMTDYLNMNQLSVTGTSEGSWIASCTALAMAPGCWIAGAFMEKFGRRGSFFILSPVFLISWLIVALASSYSWLIVGRFMCGLCSGFNGPLSPVFIAETSEPRLRGILLAGISLAIAIGILISQILGTWLHWRLTALLCGLFPAISFILCAFAPESPTWLVKREKAAKAHKIWVRIRGVYCEQEFEALQASGAKTKGTVDVEKETENSAEKTSALDNNLEKNSTTPPNWKTIIVTGTFLKPLFIIILFFFVAQFAGINAVAFYSVTMFKDVAGPENAYTAMIILDIIRVVFSVLACWLTRNYRRRSLMIASGIGTAITLLGLSGSQLMEVGKPWLPICFLFAYMCSVSIGLVPLPWLLCGELFASRVRGLGSGLTSSMGFIFFFIVVKAAPGMLETLGSPGTFACYGAVAFGGTIFLYFFLPETKDKTLTEIEERFKSSKSKSIKKVQGSVPESNQHEII